MHTSSISMLRSARVACVTHFSTTLDANLCCESVKTLPSTDLMSVDLSSGFPCSANGWKRLKAVIYDYFTLQLTQNMLDDVVSVLVLNELFGVHVQLGKDG